MKHREENLQLAVAKWLFMQYPKLLWNHNPSGGARPKRKIKGKWVTTDGTRLKKMGARAGIPDIMIYRIKVAEGRIKYCGLAIELKVIYPDGRKGRLSEDQKKVLKELSEQRWQTIVCYDFDETVEIIEEYLGTR